MNAIELLARLNGVRSKSNRSMALCPAHDDSSPSLSIREANGRILLHCFAGCSLEQICAALGIKSRDLLTPKEPPECLRSSRQSASNSGHIVATYNYLDEDGILLFQTVRFEPKGFAQRRPDSNGWTWDLKGVRRVPYRLPELIAAEQSAIVFICEGEKDVDQLRSSGLVATTSVGGAGRWRDEYNEPFHGRDICILPDNDEPGRHHAVKVAHSLQGIAASVRILALSDLPDKGDVCDWIDAGGTMEELKALSSNAPIYRHTAEREVDSDKLRCAIDDSRPKICLPGDNRLLSDFAVDLARHVRDMDIYYRNGEIVTLTDNDLRVLSPQSFRTWCEQFMIGYRSRHVGKDVYEIDVTMRDAEARGVLASPQFIAELRRVRGVNRCRLPILDCDSKLKLLPTGYHAASETLTLPEVEYAEMSLSVAVETINGLLAEFCFADGERSKAVAVSAMVGLFIKHLLPEGSLRPCFVFVANAEGAGKTLLAQLIMTQTMGATPVSTKDNEEAELRKVILTTIREGRAVIFLDNLKGHLSSSVLEAFLSAPKWTDRKLGVNENITGDNLATVFITGNGLTISPDMRRRSLFIELYLEHERPEDRKFHRTLDIPTLLEMRPAILSALWALVQHWDTIGRSLPSQSHSAFQSWANLVGGIVEAAGFICPLRTADITAAVDQDGEDMRMLVKAMAETALALSFGEVIALAREHGLFERILGTTDDELGRREKASLSSLLTRYDRRLITSFRFLVVGKGKTRRYRVEQIGDAGHAGDAVLARQTLLSNKEDGSGIPCLTMTTVSKGVARVKANALISEFGAPLGK